MADKKVEKKVEEWTEEKTDACIDELVNNALTALDEFEGYDQETVDYIVAKMSVAGLDKHGVVHIRNVIKGLRAEGKTVILASHNQVDIDELCDTVCEMDAGVLTVVR